MARKPLGKILGGKYRGPIGLTSLVLTEMSMTKTTKHIIKVKHNQLASWLTFMHGNPRI